MIQEKEETIFATQIRTSVSPEIREIRKDMVLNRLEGSDISEDSQVCRIESKKTHSTKQVEHTTWGFGSSLCSWSILRVWQALEPVSD